MSGSEDTWSAAVGDRGIAVWPDQQQLPAIDQSIRATAFADIGAYHPTPIETILELAAAKWRDDRRESRILGGRKVHHLEQWNRPEADLVKEPAKELFRRTLRSPTANIDLS